MFTQGFFFPAGKVADVADVSKYSSSHVTARRAEQSGVKFLNT